jgi:hypothetical protein
MMPYFFYIFTKRLALSRQRPPDRHADNGCRAQAIRHSIWYCFIPLLCYLLAMPCSDMLCSAHLITTALSLLRIMVVIIITIIITNANSIGKRIILLCTIQHMHASQHCLHHNEHVSYYLYYCYTQPPPSTKETAQCCT